jgi:hypothetical protein
MNYLNTNKMAFALTFCIAVASWPLKGLATPNSSNNYSIVTNQGVEDTPLLAIGQLSSINKEESLIQVNGQLFLLDLESEVETSTGISKDLDEANLSVGDHVAITGELIEPGLSLSTSVIVFDDTFVAGGSTSYLRAIVGSYDTSTAIAKSGYSVIELSGISGASIEVGSEIEVFGSAYGSTFVSNELLALTTTSSTQRINGTGVRRINGTGVRRINGTGVRRINGTGVRRINGTGVRRINGTGVRRINGTGVRRINGTGVR